MYSYKAKIIRVIDADTVEAEVDLGFHIKITEKFRILNYDAPETHRPRNLFEKKHGMEATKKAKSLLEGKEFNIYTAKDKKGKYGRYLVTIELDTSFTYARVMKDAGYEKKEKY